MSGILDSKSRVLDSIVTLEGRKQLANGGINIRYVTFTDGATFYAADVLSGSADATSRLYLEASHLPQDQITIQSDFDGRLEPFGSSGLLDVLIKNGQVFKTGFTRAEETEILSGSVRPMFTTQVLSGDTLSSVADGLLTASIENFNKNYIISSKDEIFDDDGFGVGNKETSFVLTSDRPISRTQGSIANIDTLPEIYADPKFSNFINFKYLPPINRIDDQSIDKTNSSQVNSFLLGDYKPWGETKKLNQVDVIKNLAPFASQGYVKTFNFDPTSRANNLFIQVFELEDSAMNKLDIIDFGTWFSTSQEADEYQFVSPNKIGQTVKILFVGKLITKKETNTNSFIHLFTMLFG